MLNAFECLGLEISEVFLHFLPLNSVTYILSLNLPQSPTFFFFFFLVKADVFCYLHTKSSNKYASRAFISFFFFACSQRLDIFVLMEEIDHF